jgi:hypothetical protein
MVPVAMRWMRDEKIPRPNIIESNHGALPSADCPR